MIIDVSDKLSGSFDFTYKKGAKNFQGFQAELISDVVVSGEFHKSDAGYYVCGHIDYDAEYPCAKCIKPVIQHYNLAFDEVFTEDSEEYAVTNDKIDLTPVVDETIVLNIENRVLCAEECRGLCPVCGKDLNKRKCDCDNKQQATSPFEVLIDISKGGAEDGSTEKKNI
ncbi:MAG: YceD family protein [Christensenellales bacterium]|jgi:uncharacterized protein